MSGRCAKVGPVAASAGAKSPLGRVFLVVGPEEFVNERYVAEIRSAVLALDPEAEIGTITGESLTEATFDELSAPSLFSTTRLVVVTEADAVDDTVHPHLVDYAGAPDPDICVVLVHPGGPKGSGLLTRLRKLPSVSEHKSDKVRAGGHLDFVGTEVRRRGERIEREAAEFLVQAVGTDLRGLASAVDQLCHDFPGTALDLTVARRYFSGRAEVKGFDIADKALDGHLAEALTELRWALNLGVDGPAITGPFAFKVRQLARLLGSPRGMRDADLARDVGVPPFAIKRLRAQLRGWEPEGMASAVQAVATADAAVKGQAEAAAYELERMLFRIVGARRGASA
jgi:DNA polymerase III subunit delta